MGLPGWQVPSTWQTHLQDDIFVRKDQKLKPLKESFWFSGEVETGNLHQQLDLDIGGQGGSQSLEMQIYINETTKKIFDNPKPGCSSWALKDEDVVISEKSRIRLKIKNRKPPQKRRKS